MTIIDRFIYWLEAERRYSPLTVRNYRRDIDDFLGYLDLTHETFNPRNISRESIEEWIVYLTEQRNLGAASINRGVATLRTLWRWMLAHKLVDKDIVSGLRSLKGSHRLPVFVPDSRMVDVVEGVKADLDSEDYDRRRDAMVVVLFFTTGLRLSELANANVEDVAADYSSIRVVGKGRKERLVPLL